MTGLKLLVGPFNRVEGDLEISLDIADGRVQAAYANSPLYRGFERILLGKAPLDALTITPRICGICSISQSAAAARALADAAGVTPAPEGEKVATLLHGVENLADHLTHFNLFFMPDFTRPAYASHTWHHHVVSRFTAQEGASIRAALQARAQLFHVVGLLGGKWPHTLAIQPGGVTRAPTMRDKIRMKSDLRAFRGYLTAKLFGAPPEAFAELDSIEALEAWDRGDAGLFVQIAGEIGLAAMGAGHGRYLSFGAYPGAEGPAFARGVWRDGALHAFDTAEIVEDLSHAWMLGDAVHPRNGQTLPDEAMREDAYSWCKAPRLSGQAYETGALARQVVDGHPLARALANEGGVRARVVGRLLEIARLQCFLEKLLEHVDTNARFMKQADLPQDGAGEGLVEAARGALGHWIRVKDGQIAGYQIVAPTTWNFSPRDSSGTPGPVEAALEGAEVAEGDETPVSVQHIVRSFDPCMFCTVH